MAQQIVQKESIDVQLPRTVSSFTPIKRNERNHYLFQQVIVTLFPNIPPVTVRGWVRKIGKSLVRTTTSERIYLQQQGLSGMGYVISEDDLRALVEYSKTRRPYTKRNSQSNSSVTNIQSPDVSIRTQVNNEPCHSLVEMPDEPSAGVEPAEDTVAISSEMPETVTHHASDNFDSSRAETLQVTSQPNLVSVKTPAKVDSPTSNPTTVVCSNEQVLSTFVPSKIGCLKRDDTCPELQLQLNELSEFYTSSVNPLRNCSAFSPSTLKKFLERVKCFLNFCRIKYPQRKLDFTVVDDVEIVQTYTTYQIEERKLNISTVVRTTTALINLCKFVHRNNEDVESCVHLVRLKNVQRQLSQRQHSYHLAAKAGLCGDKTPSFMFHHLLDTIKSLKEKVDSCRGSQGHTRILHDFLMIALYVTSMCGRSKEVRTLELFDESEEGNEFQFDWKRKCNVFVVSAGEAHTKFTLYENDFKTLKSHGPSKFEMDNSMWLIPYVKEYVQKRQELLSGKSHSFMFMTVTGLAFSSASFTTYLSAVFEREVSIRAGTTKLRHALVTHVLSLPEAESLRLRESLAELMRHSLKHQQRTYCDISRQEKTLLSRNLLNKSVEEAAIELRVSSTSSQNDIVESRERPRGDTVCVGDMVALLDNVSTYAENAVIFVGRVLKVSENEVLLMEFRCVDSSKRLYRSVVASSWWESLDSLISPIDIVYDRKNEVYELRSSPADIYRVVYPEH